MKRTKVSDIQNFLPHFRYDGRIFLVVDGTKKDVPLQRMFFHAGKYRATFQGITKEYWYDPNEYDLELVLID